MSGVAETLGEVALVGTGAYLPVRVVTNDELGRTLATDDAWIDSRTGIRQRHWAAPEEATSDLGAHAARQALEDAGLAASDIDLVICATSTPDHSQPATAARIHDHIGMRDSAGAIDVNVVCTGWVVALQLAAAQLAAMTAWNHVLVVGAETYSRIVDQSDRRTAVLFGDGAGAAVLSRVAPGTRPGALRIASFRFGTVTGDADALLVPAGGAREPLTDLAQFEAKRLWLQMDGPRVRDYAIAQLPAAVAQACADAGIAPADLDLLVPHQSNLRIIEAAVADLGMPMDRVVTTIADTANTAAASVPIALDAALRAGRITPGAAICLVGYGGGLSWAASVLRADA